VARALLAWRTEECRDHLARIRKADVARVGSHSFEQLIDVLRHLHMVSILAPGVKSDDDDVPSVMQISIHG